MQDVSIATPIARTRAGLHLPRWATLGILFGFLGATSIALFGPIGVSGTYPRVIGSIARQVAPAFASDNPYLVKMGSVLTPESMLVVGLLIGGLIASLVTRSRAPKIEPINAYEKTPARRYVNAFAGGFLILFGARLAGGCTSGHIISGITQLAVSSMIFAAGVFATAFFTAHVIKEARGS